MPELWRIAPGQQLAARGWDDECVLYNNLSGDTHLLDSDSMEVLAYLQRRAATADALVRHFADGLDPDDAAALPETMTALLHKLDSLFLIESAPASAGASAAPPC